MLIDTLRRLLRRGESRVEGGLDDISKMEYRVGERDFPFYYRQSSRGDRGVIEQIFTQADYDVSYWPQGEALVNYYNTHLHTQNQALIIDAGANIGASVVYFCAHFPNTFVYALEPEPHNYQLLKLNTSTLSVKAVESAIGCEEGFLYLQDPGLSDWGFRVADSGHADHKVAVISPNQILESLVDKVLFPFIFKVDIEGGEANLFLKNLEWMNLFPLIIIELHDWMLPFQGSSTHFIKAIAAREFDIVYRGENLFCFNRALLKEMLTKQ